MTGLPPTSYRSAVAALQARGRFGVRLGLGRTRALLRELGDPQLGIRGALVGGTNGKGSVQALVSAALRAAGVRVGQTPKPHLVSYRERIVVDGAPIAAADFTRLIADVLEAAERVPARLGPPTEFELVTGAAFTWLARAGVDVAVVEVGLGGRLDATNAWDGGVAAITNVGLDHMEWLGDTVVAIAREKAAIIKRGDHAVTGASGDALAVIRRRTRRMSVPLEVVPVPSVVSMGRDGLVIHDVAMGTLRVGLLGRHQAANAGVALGVLRALDAEGIGSLEEAAIRSGFAAARWPGRLELLSQAGGGDVLLDGAHNADGAAALAAAVDELAPHLTAGKATLLLGILRDKDAAAMTAALRGSRTLRDARVIATTVPDTPRALPAADVARAWGAGSRAIDDADTALGEALDARAASGGPLIVAGSLYLVGHVRARLVDDPQLRDPEEG